MKSLMETTVFCSFRPNFGLHQTKTLLYCELHKSYLIVMDAHQTKISFGRTRTSHIKVAFYTLKKWETLAVILDRCLDCTA